MFVFPVASALSSASVTSFRPWHVSSPRHVEPSVWFSHSTLTCLLHLKGPFARSTALIAARWEAWAQPRNQRLAHQRQRAKSCGSRGGLNLSPVYRLRAIRRGQGSAGLMPSPGSWITAALYFWGAYSCRATSIHLKAESLEPRAWTAIAVLLALLGVSELLQLQPALTNFGRSTAFDEGWYSSRFHQDRCCRNCHIQPRTFAFCSAHIARVRNHVGMRSYDCRLHICPRSFPTPG
jgi:hypothetical protein